MTFGFIVLGIVVFYFRIKQEIAPQDRLWFAAAIVVVYSVFLLSSRVTRRKTNRLVRLEISESGVAFSVDGGRTEMEWTAFSECIESPNLFVLVDRPKVILNVVPKRAFRDEAAQNWFRGQASQSLRVAAVAAAAPDGLEPDRRVKNNGIALQLQLKFWDYLDRSVTSWRTRGIFICVFMFITGTIFFSTPPPDAVNSPLKTFFIMVPMFAVIMVLVTFVISLASWRGERKTLLLQQIFLTNDGIEFAGRASRGRLPWSTYKYFRETRWSFFVWHPQGSLWLMFPKREFASVSDQVRFRAILQARLKPSRWFYL